MEFADGKPRCEWVTTDQIYMDYHDLEWGRPTYDDRKLFEMLCLEGAQAGLSWITILKRRENYKQAFVQFNPEKVSQYNESNVQELLQDKGIIRNERKIRSVITNAQVFLAVRKEYGTFSAYIWQFVGGKPIQNDWDEHADVPASTAESVQMSKDMKKRGFKFVGPTICYAYMQATGMVNDHTKGCFLYERKT